MCMTKQASWIKSNQTEFNQPRIFKNIQEQEQNKKTCGLKFYFEEWGTSKPGFLLKWADNREFHIWMRWSPSLKMMGSPLFWDGLLVDWYPTFRSTTWDIHLDPFGRSPRALPGRFNRKGAVGYHHRRWFACALPHGFLILLPVESCGSWWSLCHWRPGDQLLAAWQKGLRAPCGTCESEFVFPPGNVAMPKMANHLNRRLQSPGY